MILVIIKDKEDTGFELRILLRIVAIAIVIMRSFTV